MLRTAISFKSSNAFLKRAIRKSPLYPSLISRSFPISTYVQRHIGPQHDKDEIKTMLSTIGFNSVDELLENVIPPHIRLNDNELNKMKSILGPGAEEFEALAELHDKMNNNLVNKSYIGMGYYDVLTPTPILRNIIENPSWYTPYTPYQAEIAQGRLEMLLNFQTMIKDIVGKELSNASLLDEATACAEAVSMCLDLTKKKKLQNPICIVSNNCHPQNIDVIKTRADPIGITVNVVNDIEFEASLSNPDVFCALTQYPDTYGNINDRLEELTGIAHTNSVLMIASTDLMACSILKPPGECGVDIVVGSAQRFGVPLGYGGPHAAFLATSDVYKRKMPGRVIGVSKDSRNKPALRMTLQTREQHIRREKATSNICTAQALLANVAASYGVYHGPNGIKNIANRINVYTQILSYGLTSKLKCCKIKNQKYFDTITVEIDNKFIKSASDLLNNGYLAGINFRYINDQSISISLDETTTLNDINNIFRVFENSMNTKSYYSNLNANDLINELPSNNNEGIPSELRRSTAFMENDTFNQYHSETAFMRYLYSLERKDLGLNTAMIPLGSCTMKLNSATVMIPVTWNTVNGMHPFAPQDQTKGYQSLISDMELWLATATGFDAVSLQPNSGAQGEYTGLLTIREYHKANGELNRKKCLIPTSAHGTNPASAAMVGFDIIPVKCDDQGYIDVDDLKLLANKYSNDLAGCMITYPSTHGVFEDNILDVCNIIHSAGGLVYMDGANLQAQLTATSPGKIGADVCHLNLHKTFCIPHGGGGPGLGPICVNNKLKPYLPTHSILDNAPYSTNSIGAIASAPYSSASILVIPWMYIKMMGFDGLTEATKIGILNANYMAARLNDYWKIMYRRNNLCAHEFIIDVRNYYKKDNKTKDYIYKIGAEDVAKRLMDYSFHAPTMSWPVTDTLMVEPTESEPLSELNRLCDALISIRNEISDVENGNINIEDTALRNSPHTIDTVLNDNWNRKYTRITAAVNPEKSYWPSVGRIDNVSGDKYTVCECPTVEQLAYITNDDNNNQKQKIFNQNNK